MPSFSWPSTTGGSSSNASIGPNGSTAPTSATLVGGENPSGNLTPIQLDASGNLLVSLAADPTGPLPVTQSGVWNITNITGTVSLPTGASTSSLQTSGNTTLSTISTTLGSILLDLTNGTQVTSVNNFPATQPISGTVAATQSGTWNITNISGTVSLPTGAATSANQATEITSLATIATNTTGSSTAALQTTGNTSLASILSNQTNGTQKFAQVGTVISNTPIQNVYSSTNITTTAYVQLVASTSNVINTLHIFDSSGQAMILGIGASGSEVTTLYVPPGGDTYTLTIPAGSRLAYKALTATANAGYLLMSFLE